ncbi:MAG: hypothetical protein H6974_09535 [Gammaproteobacteria bacterium]|nr:hypothetical protein [Gammaproteobacteria bacterium]
MKRNQPIIIYGPQGCGKTQHAEQFRELFHTQRVIDDWSWGDPLLEGDMALTNSPIPEPCPDHVRVFEYEKLIHRVSHDRQAA